MKVPVDAKWRRLLDKAREDRELALALFAETSEKYRHWVNTSLALAAMYLALAALGVDSAAVTALFAAAVCVSLVNAARWLRVISVAEEILSGDPMAGVREFVLEYLDGLLSAAIVLALLALGLAISLFRP